MSLILPSTNSAQCHVVLLNALKSSPNNDIGALWSRTSSGCNIQYDQYSNTKQVLNVDQNDNEDRIRHKLKSKDCIISLPEKSLNFSVKYINNALATKKNLCKWSLSPINLHALHFQSETL